MAGRDTYLMDYKDNTRLMMVKMNELRLKQDLVDVTLSCEGKKIHAHKLMLAACSVYFRTVFQENPCQHPVIIFRNTSFQDLNDIIEFVYKGKIHVTEARLSSFLKTAELLQVQGLTSLEADEIKNAMHNASETAEMAPEVPKERTSKRRKDAPDGSGPPQKMKAKSPPQQNLDPNIPAFEAVYLTEGNNSTSNKTVNIKQERLEANAESESDKSSNADAIDPSYLTDDPLTVPSASSESKSEEGKKPPTILKCANGYKCIDCNLVYGDYIELQKHLRWHFGGPLCPHCHKEISNPTILTNHIAMHKKRTNCRTCSLVMGSYEKLLAHELSCSFVPCEQCHGVFTSDTIEQHKISEQKGVSKVSVILNKS